MRSGNSLVTRWNNTRQCHVLQFCLSVGMALLLGNSVGFAQTCAGGYDRSDRQVVVAQDLQAQAILNRLADLAELSASGVFSVVQRLALQNEFDALRVALADFGDSVRPNLSSRSNQFLAAVMDPDYLGLSSLRIVGSTIAESQIVARLALDGVNGASTTIKTCLWGSWERHVITGSANDGVCGGGYALRDFLLVQRQIRLARRILDQMRQLSQAAVEGVFSVSQRNLLNFDFEYLREDLDLFGERFRPFASNRTNRYLATLIDPVFLDLLSSTITGSSMLESQNNARSSLVALRNASITLGVCSSPLVRQR